jgi:hypothetical protein
MKAIKSRSQVVRLAVQIVMFVLVATLAIVKWIKETGVVVAWLPEISLHAVCPFGGVVTIWEYVTSGQFVPKLHSAAFVLMGLGVAVAVFFGPLFCGYVCPMGSFQEWIAKLGKKLFGSYFGTLIPTKLDIVLRYMRYAVLALVVYLTAVTGKLIFVEVDPYYALFNFYTGEVVLSAFIVLGGVVLLSFIIERPWCKYFCPYGAFLGLFNLIRILPLRRNAPTCINCKKCDKACPMQIKVSANEAVRDHQCISCHKCVSGAACPVADTVAVSAGREGKVKINPNIVTLFAALFVIAGISVSVATGYWATESDKIPQKLDVVSATGEYDPADIRGSYTMGEISNLYGVPLEDLAGAFLIKMDEAEGFQVKSLETAFENSNVEIGTASVRLFVAWYKSLPFAQTGEDFLPEPAVLILKEQANLTEVQTRYLDTHTYVIPK